MKIKGSKDINRSRKIVTDLFADPKYLGEYPDGFIKKELISGKEGKTRAISKMYYKQGNRNMVLTETITNNNLPDSFESSYHHKHMDNTMKCTFTVINDAQTRYDYEVEYTEFRGFAIKLMAFLFSGFFKKQIEKWMNQFKAFVEKW